MAEVMGFPASPTDDDRTVLSAYLDDEDAPAAAAAPSDLSAAPADKRGVQFADDTQTGVKAIAAVVTLMDGTELSIHCRNGKYTTAEVGVGLTSGPLSCRIAAAGPPFVSLCLPTNTPPTGRGRNSPSTCARRSGCRPRLRPCLPSGSCPTRCVRVSRLPSLPERGD